MLGKETWTEAIVIVLTIALITSPILFLVK
jgi:hypothetical protein